MNDSAYEPRFLCERGKRSRHRLRDDWGIFNKRRWAPSEYGLERRLNTKVGVMEQYSDKSFG